MAEFDVKQKWVRATRAHPCPVCKKPDWCAIGERFVNCMRLANEHPCNNGGWLWPKGNDAPAARPVREWRPEPAEHHDFNGLMREWRQDTARLSAFAAQIGASKEALESLECAWSEPYRAWAFPMKDGSGATIGIRLRTDAGKKFAVRGSRQGLFESSNPAAQTAFICEGPTDTAAALSIGLWAVGRPSCSCGNEQLKVLLAARGVRRAVILADNDTPGINGAQRLATEICLPCALLILPAKDCRAFIQCGGTRQLVEVLLKQTLWRNPS